MRNIELENHDVSLDEEQIRRLFADIDKRTQNLSADSRTDLVLMSRAMDFALLQDYTNAEQDLDNAISANPSNWALWFLRSQVRERNAQMLRADGSLNFQQGRSGGVQINADAGYQYVIRDLTQAIELEPSFAYAYYNRGTFYAITNDLHAALMDFDKALELDENLAEAWYNRGLVLILLNRTDDATRDLSKLQI